MARLSALSRRAYLSFGCLDELFDETDNPPANFQVADSDKGSSQRQSFRRRHKEIDGRRKCRGSIRWRRWLVLVSIEEKHHGHLQGTGNLLKPACANPIDAFLVFLNLLIGQIQSVAQVCLRHLEHHATRAHSFADVTIDGVGWLCGQGAALVSKWISIDSVCSATEAANWAAESAGLLGWRFRNFAQSRQAGACPA